MFSFGPFYRRKYYCRRWVHRWKERGYIDYFESDHQAFFYTDSLFWGFLPIKQVKMFEEEIPSWYAIQLPILRSGWESSAPKWMHDKCNSQLIEDLKYLL